MKKSKELFTALIIILFQLTLLNLNTIASSTQVSNTQKINTSDSEIDFDGYIIQFNEEPVLSYKNQLIYKIKTFFSYLSEKAAEIFLNENIQKYKEGLISLHNKAKQEIQNILNTENLKIFFSSELYDLYNDVCIKNVNSDDIKKLENLPYIKCIFPNYKFSVQLDDSVPLINADDVWKMKDSFGRNITGQGITIAIIDTGVNYSHPDLKDNYISNGSYDYINEDNDPMDDHGHGTHCAGIAVGKGNNSNYKYVGVAPDAKFYALKIMDNKGNGDYESYSKAMTHAVSLGVDIVSLSFGTSSPGVPNDPLCEIADNAVNQGIVVVAAAGNNGSYHNISSPGCAQKVICVGASDNNDKIAYFSSRGPVEWDGNYMVKPDIVAPGVSITSTNISGGYSTKSGTSMSTPHVAGAAALVLQENPDFKPDDVKNLLKSTAVDFGYDCNTQGSGRIDLLRVFSDNEVLFIKTVDEVYETQFFTINITNKTGQPVKAWILLTAPFHLPQLKYGSTVTFRAPIIFRFNKEILEGKIRVFKKISILKIINKGYDCSKSIIIKNSK